MKLTTLVLALTISASSAFAQQQPVVGATFVALDSYTRHNTDGTFSFFGWALKCNGTILGVNTYARSLGGLWTGWNRANASLYARSDVAFAFMADTAGVNRCAHPTEYNGFEVRVPSTDLIVGTTYDFMVCVEDSTGGRGHLTRCSSIVRSIYSGPGELWRQPGEG